MCSPARCSRRGRTPWTGRGMHAFAMANIPQAQHATALIGRPDQSQVRARGRW